MQGQRGQDVTSDMMSAAGLGTLDRSRTPHNWVGEPEEEMLERLRVKQLRMSIPWQGQLATDGNEAGAWNDVLRIVAIGHFRCDPHAALLKRVCKKWWLLWTIAEGQFAVEVNIERSHACVRATHNRPSARTPKEQDEWGRRLHVYASAERAKTRYVVDRWTDGWHRWDNSAGDVREADRLIFQPQIGDPERMWRYASAAAAAHWR